MKNNYINIYNNLVKLTRNKDLYKNFIDQDTFSDRLIFFSITFCFLFERFIKKITKRKLLTRHL